MRGAAEDALRFEFFHLRGCEARVFRQDLFVMFPEKRRFEVESLGEFREAQRKARHLEIAQHAIMHAADAAALPEMRMLEGFGDRQDRRMRHAMLLKAPLTRPRHSAS